MIRLVIAFLCATAACMLVAGAFSSSAQAPANPTPDTFVTQITRSARDSFVNDTSANGRFVVIESNGDIATEKTSTRHNQDGNREIFLYDYAQRRIFQITDTKSVLKPAGSPSPSPTPSPSPSVSPSPTPSPTATPVSGSDVAVEISNNRPMISLEPPLASGQRTYTIVFSSNAPTLGTFDGTASAALAADGNQEVWIYRFTVPEVADLSSGADVGPIDLTAGTFTRITDTPASRAPSPGATFTSPFIADDNRDATVSDSGEVLAFISTRNLAVTNADANPEVFLTTVGSGVFTQVTNTTTTSANNPIFSANPCLSSDGSVLAFVSNANLTANNDDSPLPSNAEIYLRDAGGLRQVTKTKADASGATALLFTFGRRLSRDGKFISFESIASDPSANGTNTSFYVSFVYNVVANTFAQLGPRATAAPGDPVLHLPVFTDYNAALSPASVMFTSGLNFKSDGTFPAAADDATGLNPARNAQIFVASLPVQSTGPFTRMTTTPTTSGFSGVGAFPSASRKRFAFSRAIELGLGNTDGSLEAFYQLTPDGTESNATLALFTGASLIPVAVPTASPSGSPAPNVAPGLAPGELAVAQPSPNLVISPASVLNNNASEAGRSPSLPIELNGLSVSIGGAACGLYSVSPTTISFVVPIGLVPNAGTASYPIVINNNGTVIRGQVVIVAAQPDIFTDSNGPGGRAVVCNVTNPTIATCVIEPFNVTTPDASGTLVPTVLEVHVTGVRGTAASAITVTIGTTVIVPSNVIVLDQPGFEEIVLTLPATVDRGDLPIVIKVGTATSRPSDSAPHVKINP